MRKQGLAMFGLGSLLLLSACHSNNGSNMNTNKPQTEMSDSGTMSENNDMMSEMPSGSPMASDSGMMDKGM